MVWASVREGHRGKGNYNPLVGRIGWWLLVGISTAFIVLVAAAVWRPDKWTGVFLLSLAALYVGVMAVVGTVAFVVTSLVRSKRAADQAQRAAADV